MRRHASFGRDALIVAIAAAAGILLVSGAARRLHLSLQTDVAPAITAAGVIVAVSLFYLREASDRRRKTLEAFEKQLYDRDLRAAVSMIVTVLRQGTYEPDTEIDRPGSHRDLTSFIINYVEACCEGAERGLYERRMIRGLLLPLAELLIGNFRVERGGMPSRRFLEFAPMLRNMHAIFSGEFARARSRARSGARAATAVATAGNAGR